MTSTIRTCMLPHHDVSENREEEGEMDAVKSLVKQAAHGLFHRPWQVISQVGRVHS